MSEWLRVDRGNPCPVCGRDSWCTVSADGSIARCMRVDSDRESEGADGSLGWIHNLSEPITISPERLTRETPERLPADQIANIAKQAFNSPRAALIRESLAEELGVTVKSLEMLRVGVWNDEHDGREWSSWPSRDSKGNIIGITRRYADNSKKSLKGTSNGLFYPMERESLKGPILILEGGSDVAKATSLGLRAIGRPSNTGGHRWVSELIQDQFAIVVGENDECPEKRGGIPSCKPDCIGCGHCFPGKWGGQVFAKKINRPFIMPPDGAKDFREITSVWSELIRCL